METVTLNFLEEYKNLPDGVPTEVASRLELTLPAIVSRCLRGHEETWRMVGKVMSERADNATDLCARIDQHFSTQQTDAQ